MFRQFINIVILLSAGILASCNSMMDEGDCPVTGGAARSLFLTLAIDNPTQHTRAPWSDSYESEAGNTFDTRIAMSGLQVVFYSVEGNYIGRAEGLVFWNDGTARYNIAGDISHLNMSVGKEYKVMVLANANSVNGNMGTLTYSINSIAYPNGYIPMWGVKQWTFTADEQQNLGTVLMLRAVAKVEVVLADNMVTNGYALESVTINHWNATGYCAPAGWNEVSSTEQIDQEKCINTEHDHKSGSLPFYEVVADKRFIIYLSEFAVKHTAENIPKLSVTLSDGTALPLVYNDAISFGKYSNDGYLIDGEDAVNIVRNHIYRFTIIGIGSALELDYSVMNWADADEWDLVSFQYPTYHSPVVPYITPSVPSTITTSPVMTYDALNPIPFSCWFNITEPAGLLWTPVIDKSLTMYDIKVFDPIGNDISSLPAEMKAGAGWYNIQIIPKDAANYGSIVKFGVTFEPSWMPGTPMYLFINGEEGGSNVAWPNSGTDPKIIEILQN